ncbi:MAG: enterochelin esterase [Shimia sp.]|jgi:enterochelin esterase family protein|uniref:enterochelin esterase n=1 Tax=Shimia sp. TaxID=1954381 RepID=UPI0025CE11A7|nr:enterochelin esterase [Shimia sp.]MCH2069347.1 enterochelin esterase [Shimia sp.]
MTGKLSTYLAVAALSLHSAAIAYAQTAETMLISNDTPELALDFATGSQTAKAQLVTVTGSYVEGVVEASGAPVDVILTATDGTKRRVLQDVVTRGVFRFVAEADTYDIELVSPEGTGTARVTLLRNLPPEEQLPPAEPNVAKDPVSPTLQALLAKGINDASLSAFWDQRLRDGTPLIEADPQKDPDMRLVTFLWRGATHNARLIGAPADDHVWMQKLAESDIWFASFRVRADLRMSYQIAPDIPSIPGSQREKRIALLSTLQADPLNKVPFIPTAQDRFEQQSYLALPNAPVQPSFEQTQSNLPLREQRFESAILGNQRRVWFYTPQEFTPRDPNNVLLIVFDGARYINRAQTPQVLHNLQRDGRLPAVPTVFVDSLDPETRWQELACNAEFGDAIASELLPIAQQYFGLSPTPDRTVVAGSSLGGLSSACIALNHSEDIGAFVSMSGSYWYAPEDYETKGEVYTSQLAKERSPTSIKAFLSAGTYETSRFADEFGILEGSEHLASTLQQLGHPDVTYQTYEGGHDYAIWRGALADGLLALFGNRVSK